MSSTVNPILYNVMSYRYRRAFCDTLFHRARCRRLATSSHHCASINAAAPSRTSFAFQSATASLREDRDGRRRRTRLCISPSALTSFTTTNTITVDSPLQDDTKSSSLHRGTALDPQQLDAVGCHGPPTAPELADAWTVIRTEEVAESSGPVVDAVDVHAVLER